MPHIPVYASTAFQGKSLRGIYGDTVEEIDWCVGQILNMLVKLGIEKNTLVIFSSDNGPWLSFKTHGGSAGPLRGGKQTTWEGGLREPCIFWWPGTLDDGKICTQLMTSMDILPTIAHWIDYDLTGYPLRDGQDMHCLIENPDTAEIDHYPLLYYNTSGVVEAIREGSWKLRMESGIPQLFHVEEDISEKYDLSNENPDKVKELKNQMENLDREITEKARPAGTITKQTKQ